MFPFKICVVGHPTNLDSVTFLAESLVKHKLSMIIDEIVKRMPELKGQTFRFYYQDRDGDDITIFDEDDFHRFQSYPIEKIYAVKTDKWEPFKELML